MFRHLPQITVIALIVVGGGLTACQRGESLSDDSPPVAKVNGEVITEAELQASLDGLFGKQQAATLDKAGRRKALEGLVAGRAIAQRADEELDPEKRLQIKHKVNLYRDKLLLAAYLKGHAEPKAVTDEMINEYYRNNLKEFGGGTRKEFELIMAAEKPAPDHRRALVERLGGASETSDWSAWTDALKRSGFAVNYRQAATGSDALDTRLLDVVTGLGVGQSSNVVFVGGKPVVVRVTDEEQLSAEPLHNVSAEIRKKLMPTQLKKSIKAIQDKIVRESDIEYL